MAPRHGTIGQDFSSPRSDALSSAYGGIVNSKAPRFDKDFIARKRQQLTRLREELLNSTQAAETEERIINSESAGQALEYEDDAQKLASLELEGELVGRDALRLERIARALQKIEDGTYGFSDESGAPIPIERLEAMPEAVYTVSEQKARDPIDAAGAARDKRT
jgi:DnaK suppressor protein